MTTVPLSGLLSQVLVGLAQDYEAAAGVPPLPLWSNFLRVVPNSGLRHTVAAQTARISRRALAAIVGGCERAGLALAETGIARGDAVIVLTSDGRLARERGRAALDDVETSALLRLPELAPMRDDLRTLVAQLDLEYPYFPIGYGPVDDSMTGGRARPGSPGPPRIPPHGKDWVAVARTDCRVADVPLTALLSQTLVAFAIDFEQHGVSLPTAVVWQLFPDRGLAANELPEGCPNPTGWQRHGLATIDPAPLRKGSVIALSAHARMLRDGYVARTSDIERQWRQRYGDALLTRLRHGLEGIAHEARFSALPHFPRLSWIGGLREVSSGASTAE